MMGDARRARLVSRVGTLASVVVTLALTVPVALAGATAAALLARSPRRGLALVAALLPATAPAGLPAWRRVASILPPGRRRAAIVLHGHGEQGLRDELGR